MMVDPVQEKIEMLAERGRAKMLGSSLFGRPLNVEDPMHVLAVLAVQTSLLESQIGMLQGLNEIERLARSRERERRKPFWQRVLRVDDDRKIRAGGAGQEGRSLRTVQSIADGSSNGTDQ